MHIKAIKKTIVVAASLLSAWIAAPNRAEASSFVNPFSVAATGRIATYSDGIWVAWIPTSGTCASIAWQYVGPASGFTENVYLTSVGYNDTLIEDGIGTLCGNAATPVVHNGWGLYMMGNGGNDSMMARDALTYMYGGDGNDLLDSTANASWFFGQNGNDTMKSCSSTKNTEHYNGGAGADIVRDQSGTWAFKGSDVETTLTCF